MRSNDGFTLIELLVVLTIIGVAAVIVVPTFVSPNEQALANVAQNNLLAIYTAQQNYNNNNGGNRTYCLNTPNTTSAACTTDTTCGGTLAQINCNLSLNINDDGSYTYSCTGNTCTATRNGGATDGAGALTIQLTLNQPIQNAGTATGNPSCGAGGTDPNHFCP